MENKTIFEWAEMFQEQIQGGSSQSDIIQLLKEYESQALRIHDVVGRSEQLKVFDDLLDYAWDLAHLNEHYEKLNELKERF